MYMNTDTIDISQAQEGKRIGAVDLTLRSLFGLAVIAMIASTLFAMNTSQEARIPMHFDGAVYDSVSGLSTSADSVVEVKVIKVVDRFIDYGGEKPVASDPREGESRNPGGLATVLYEVEVQNSMIGKLQPGDRILVPLLNENKIDSEHVTKLNKGKEYVLFLSQMDGAKAAGFDTGGQDLYLPLNYNNGVLAINGSEVHLNRWVLGLDAFEAEWRVKELAEMEFAKGRMAVEAELDFQTEVTVDREMLLKVVEASR